MNCDTLSALLIVQERDRKINKLAKDLANLPELRAKIVLRLDTAKKRTHEAKRHMQETEVAIRNVEAEVEQKRQLIIKYKIQQGETRKNEEFQRYISEIAKTEQLIDALETRQLELMDSLETIKSDCAAQTAKLKEVERSVEEELAHFDHTAEEDKKRITSMKQERAELAASVDPDLLSIYDRMSMSKGLPVVVDMTEQGQCTGCYTILPPSVKLKVMGGEGIVYCDNCHRILH